MRQIVLDTETTGLEPSEGHRIIEIGAVELLNRRPTGRHLHHYVQPDREIEDGALAVHGITAEFLADKPKFDQVASALIEFVRGCELIIHNAEFDLAFLNRELERLDPPPGRIEDYCSIIDSLAVARRKHPGQKNSLDALCRRYAVENTQRELHGALLDAQILADVYLAMTGGQTALFAREQRASEEDVSLEEQGLIAPEEAASLRRVVPTPEEVAAHEAQLDLLDEQCEQGSLWRRLSGEGQEQQR